MKDIVEIRWRGRGGYGTKTRSLLLMRFPSLSLGNMGIIVDGSVVIMAIAAFRNDESGLSYCQSIYLEYMITARYSSSSSPIHSMAWKSPSLH